MRLAKRIHVISAHAEGEVGDVIVGGVLPPPGDTIWARSRWIAHDIAKLGVKITNAANAQLEFDHPDNPDWRHISFCLFAGPLTEGPDGLEAGAAVAIQPGKVDRVRDLTDFPARVISSVCAVSTRNIAVERNVLLGDKYVGGVS